MEERVVNPSFGSIDAAADRITLLPSRGLEDCSNDEAVLFAHRTAAFISVV